MAFSCRTAVGRIRARLVAHGDQPERAAAREDGDDGLALVLQRRRPRQGRRRRARRSLRRSAGEATQASAPPTIASTPSPGQRTGIARRRRPARRRPRPGAGSPRPAGGLSRPRRRRRRPAARPRSRPAQAPRRSPPARRASACRSCRRRHGSTFAAASITAPPFISSPRRAPADSAEAMEAGTEITSAQGQPISSSARPR